MHVGRPDRGSLRREIAAGSFMFIAGIGLAVVGFLFVDDAPLNPVDAYCRGVTDGQVHSMEMNRAALQAAGIPIVEADGDLTAANDEACAAAVGAGNIPEWLRGPLTSD